jgi:hypothetical protein
MPEELGRKIKALLFIAVLAGAEVHQVNENVRLNSMSPAAEKQAMLEAMVAGSSSPQNAAEFVAKGMEEMQADPGLQEQAQILKKRMAEMQNDANFRGRAQNILEEMQAMDSNLNMDAYLENVATHMQDVIGDANLKEQAQRIEAQLQAIAADQKLGQQAKAAYEQMEAMMEDPAMQQRAQVFAEEVAKNPEEQEKLMNQQLKEMFADPGLREQLEPIAKRVEAIVADPALQMHAWRVASDLQEMKADTKLRELETRVVKPLEAKLADENLQQRAKSLHEQMEAMDADPHLKELARRVAEPMEAVEKNQNLQEMAQRLQEQMASTEKVAKQDTMDAYVDGLVDRVAGSSGLFNRAQVQVSGLENADMDQATLGKAHEGRRLAAHTGMTSRNLARGPVPVRSATPFGNMHITPKMNNFGSQPLPRVRGDTLVPQGMDAIFASDGVQKTLTFLAIGATGAYLRPEVTGIMTKTQAAGAQTLMLQAMVPALVLKSLASVSMSGELVFYVAFGAALSLFRFASGWAIATGVFGPSKELGLPRRSSAHMLGGMAPALSSFPFIKEFVGNKAVGYGALIDLPNKVFVLIILPIILRAWAPGGAAGAEEPKEDPMKKIMKELRDPLNMAIIGGLTMIATGTPLSALGFFGKAVAGMSEAVTPTLFLILGLRIQLTGTTPTLCATLLLIRHGLLALAMSALMVVMPMDPGMALTLVIMSQSAVSVVSTGLITSAVSSGVPGYTAEIGIDLCGYSFPFSTMLSAVTCILGDFYLKNLPIVGALFLGAGSYIGFTQMSAFRDPNTWAYLNPAPSPSP